MLDDVLIQALIEVPGTLPDRPELDPVMSRALALRTQALLWAGYGCSKPRSIGGTVYVPVTELGPAITEFLLRHRVPLQLEAVSCVHWILPELRGVVDRQALQQLLGVELPSTASSRRHGAALHRVLGMDAALLQLLLLAECHRLGIDGAILRSLFTQAQHAPWPWRAKFADALNAAERLDPPPLGAEAPAKPAAADRAGPSSAGPRRRRRGCGFWAVADVDQIQRRLAEVELLKDRRASTEQVLGKLLAAPDRSLPMARPAHVQAVEGLVDRFPNFAAVCRWVADQIELGHACGEPLRLRPALLLGPPGIGKTMFCHSLAAALDAELCFRSLAEASASWLISGSSTQWAGGEPGVVAQHIARCGPRRLPLFVFDELDKASAGRNYPVASVLLGMLEPVTARRFRDEALEIEMDLRPASFLFTANERRRVAPELLSRMDVLEVQLPSAFELPTVIASIDAQLRRERPALARLFAPLSAHVLQCLEQVAPRDLRRHLESAYAVAGRRKAKAAGALELGIEDFPSHVVAADRVDTTLH